VLFIERAQVFKGKSTLVRVCANAQTNPKSKSSNKP
jgi:hypothetical protein